MLKSVLGIAVGTVLLVSAAPAQPMPKLTEFLLSCSRDSGPCRAKVKDFVTASVTQKAICLPKDVSINQATSEAQSWLRSDAAQPLREQPYDDALFEGVSKLYPCAPPEPAPVPPAAPATPQ